MQVTGLALFGHGAREARWREPFDRLEAMVRAGHRGPVTLAFLEHMRPGLAEACAALANEGATRIVVVPLFLGTGGHLRHDLPALLQAAAAKAGVAVTAADAVGEDDCVLRAMAEYCLHAAL